MITGVLAGGITGRGHQLELADLGLAAVVSLAMAGTVSLALTVLPLDSVTAPVDALREATELVGRGDFAPRAGGDEGRDGGLGPLVQRDGGRA